MKCATPDDDDGRKEREDMYNPRRWGEDLERDRLEVGWVGSDREEGGFLRVGFASKKFGRAWRSVSGFGFWEEMLLRSSPRKETSNQE